MLSVQSHLTQPIQVPKCFIDWVKAREVLNPTFTFIVSLNEHGDKNLSGWRLKNNVITYDQDGISYNVRILTGKPMHKRDVDPAIGFDRDTLTAIAPFVYILPLDEQPRELVSFESSSYNTLAELDKSYEASKRKNESNY